MLAGGADTFTRLIYCGFHRMSALSKGICRPFDNHRDGVSFGEGAAILVLEELEHAQPAGRASTPRWRATASATTRITSPRPARTATASCGRCARRWRQTGIAPDAVSYVSAHGTGTPYNDLGECQAMQAVFGEHGRPPCRSARSSR